MNKIGTGLLKEDTFKLVQKKKIENALTRFLKIHQTHSL